MKNNEYTLGAEVMCDDEQCGKIAKLVVDPYTHRVTDLIVEEGFLFKDSRVVPVSNVAEVTSEQVRLSTRRDNIEMFPEYRDDEFVAPAPGWEGDPGFNRDSVAYRAWPMGMMYPRNQTVPLVSHHVREGVDSDDIVLERGTDVYGLDDKIGSLDHVYVDRDTGKLSMLIVDRGLFQENVAIPADSVSGMGPERVTVDLTDEQVGELHRYAPRAEEDIIEELNGRLDEVEVGRDQFVPRYERGIVTLTGRVPDVRTKRCIEATCRQVPGVLDVKNNLETDLSSDVSGIAAALAADSRTELSPIDVVQQGGTVTLSGLVDTEAAREAAGEIAARQEGVVGVINDLSVGDDEYTPGLVGRFFAGALAYNAARPPSAGVPH